MRISDWSSDVCSSDLKVSALLAGEADANDTYIEINAGAGGTESQDWAEMLQRMYTRWAERRGYKVELIDYHAGEQAGRSEEHTSELQSIMRISYAVFCLKKKKYLLLPKSNKLIWVFYITNSISYYNRLNV